MDYSMVLNNVSSQIRGATKRAAGGIKRSPPPQAERPEREDGTTSVLNQIGLEVQRQGGT